MFGKRYYGQRYFGGRYFSGNETYVPANPVELEGVLASISTFAGDLLRVREFSGTLTAISTLSGDFEYSFGVQTPFTVYKPSPLAFQVLKPEPIELVGS